MFERLRRTRAGQRRGIQDPLDSPLDSSPSADPFYSFSPRGFDLWSFSRGHVFYNGDDIEELIGQKEKRVGELLDISSGLSEYRDFISACCDVPAELAAMIDALQGRVAKRLTGIYENLTCGVHVEKSGERFWVNNIDVSTLMKLYRLRPTPKARAYLKGFRDKLALILSRRNDNAAPHGMCKVVAEVVEELTSLLVTSPAGTPLLLLAAPGRDQ